MKVCPGCRGQYEGEPTECEWCGYPVARPGAAGWEASQRGLLARRAAFLAMTMLVVVAGLAGALVLVRQIATPVSAPPVIAMTPAPSTPPPQRQVGTEIGGGYTQVTITPDIPSARTGLVRIVRTGGTGTYIRERASRSSLGLAAWPDGAVLRAVGGRVESEGRYWLEVADAFGHVGWVPEEYLQPAD